MRSRKSRYQAVVRFIVTDLTFAASALADVAPHCGSQTLFELIIPKTVSRTFQGAIRRPKSRSAQRGRSKEMKINPSQTVTIKTLPFQKLHNLIVFSNQSFWKCL